MKCPNCKQEYVYSDKDAYFKSNKAYPIVLVHRNSTCPFGIEIYHKTKEQAVEAAREHILSKFPWITKDHEYLKEVK